MKSTIIKITVLSIFSLLLFSSCKKTKLTGDYALYEGAWSSFDTEMTLKADGTASYLFFDGTVTKTIENGRLTITGSELKIKRAISAKYHIDQEPTLQDHMGLSYYTMILDGEEFIKY